MREEFSTGGLARNTPRGYDRGDLRIRNYELGIKNKVRIYAFGSYSSSQSTTTGYDYKLFLKEARPYRKGTFGRVPEGRRISDSE